MLRCCLHRSAGCSVRKGNLSRIKEMGMPLPILPYDDTSDAEPTDVVGSPSASLGTAVVPSAVQRAEPAKGLQMLAREDQKGSAASILARMPEEKLSQLSRERRKGAFVSMLRCVELACPDVLRPFMQRNVRWRLVFPQDAGIRRKGCRAA